MRWIVILALVLPAVAQAKIYKWIDSSGGVHYSSVPHGSQSQTVQIHDNHVGSLSKEDAARMNLQVQRERLQRDLNAAPTAAPASIHSDEACTYAKNVRRSYKNDLSRLLRHGYKQSERQSAEDLVSQWDDQVRIYCN
jgi:hypothetical protein